LELYDNIGKLELAPSAWTMPQKYENNPLSQLHISIEKS
jgi:hypothetical protein